MGSWHFALDGEGQVQEVRVSIYMLVEATDLFALQGGCDINLWPLLTEGQRQQLQLIVNKALKAVEEV